MQGFVQLALDLLGEAFVSPKESDSEPKNSSILELNQPFKTAEYAGDAPEIEVIRSLPGAEPISQNIIPAQFSHPQGNRQIRLNTRAGRRSGEGGGEVVVSYLFKRAKRKSIGFVVGADGLVVSAPRWSPLYEVDKALHEKAAWIVAKLVDARERSAKQSNAQIDWKEGALIPFLGDNVILVIDPRQTSAFGQAMLQTDAKALPGVPHLTLHLGLPHDADASRIRDAVQAWLMRQAKRIFEERLNHFAPQLGVRYTKLRLSNAQTRWGSAASDGAIALNWRLIHFKQSVIDYVVVHELSHLREMNHSPKFWSTVESIMPDYAVQKTVLKEQLVPQWQH